MAIMARRTNELIVGTGGCVGHTTVLDNPVIVSLHCVTKGLMTFVAVNDGPAIGAKVAPLWK